MLALLFCALTQAAPPVSEETTYDRLFAEAPTAESVAAPVEPGPTVSSWAIPLGIFGIAGALLLYKRMQTPGVQNKAPTLRVLQRQAIGDRNALVLVEVLEPGGDLRRLLIGTGSGAPTLLSDLGVTEVVANSEMPEMKVETKAESKPEPKVEAKAEPAKLETKAANKPTLEAKPWNIADEILSERAPARSREFSKILARIGEE